MVLISLDFSKAFDRIRHKTLFDKFDKLDIDDQGPPEFRGPRNFAPRRGIWKFAAEFRGAAEKGTNCYFCRGI